MMDLSRSRSSISGQSFGTCLLIVVLVFGGIGTYYFKVFQWRDLEDPLGGLTISKETEVSQVTFFRKKSVSDIIDPIRTQHDRYLKLRKESKKGTVVPEDWKQKKTEINNRLIELMSQAKLRRIPVNLQKPYKDTLLGISDLYRAMNSLDESISSEDATLKKRAYEQSIEYAKQSKKRMNSSREQLFLP